MVKPSVKLLYYFILLVLLSCKSSVDETAAPLPEIAVSDTTLLEVLVNNLRIRQEPDLNATTLLTLPEGVMVQYWDEHSDQKVAVTLRGEKITDYWYKVKYGKATGWVFGGAIKKVDRKDAVADYLIIPGQRVGPVKSTDSEQSIIDRIGGVNVQRGEFVIGEGETMMVTYLYPSSENEMILLWDQADFKTLREIRIRKSGAKWQLTNGIRIGSSLVQVAHANNGPFLLSGFGWDYAGTTMGWQGGALPQNVALIFEPPAKIHKTLLGDRSISSDEVHMAKANPKVITIRVLF